MKSNWNYPTTVWVGKDRVKDLGEACHNLKINNPLFVTDKDLVNLPFIKEVISEIKKKLKWKPKINLNQGISKTVDWYIKNQEYFKKLNEKNFNHRWSRLYSAPYN